MSYFSTTLTRLLMFYVFYADEIYLEHLNHVLVIVPPVMLKP